MARQLQLIALEINHVTCLRGLLPLLLVFPAAAEVCGKQDVSGAYGFQLAGTSAISGTSKPMATIGRLVFESGKISGYASVNFNGLFLGNPVKGTYEFKEDCSVSWRLQDDSGGWQTFAGRATPGGEHVEFHQTGDSGGGLGLMERMPETCDAASLKGRFSFSLVSAATPFTTAAAPSSVRAFVEADGASRLTFVRASTRTEGTYRVDSDCFLQIDFALPDESGVLVTLRGVMSRAGKRVLAIQTDPERVASARFDQQ